MASLPLDAIVHLSDLHPKPEGKTFGYGTAGFRTTGNILGSVLFRVGLLASLRSKKFDGKTIGVMVTASHNPEGDNGVKLVDPRGEMLETSWETYATSLANAATTSKLVDELRHIVAVAKIDLSKPSRVLYARDTRPSGAALVQCLEDGLRAMGAQRRNEGVTTTPILHYLVRCVNTKGTRDEYGDDNEEGYYDKLSNAFKKLMAKPPPPLIMDCANGVGAIAAQKLNEHIGSILQLKLYNIATTTSGVLNNGCGADYVKTTQRLPPSLHGVLKPGERGCSLDGDADRLMYFYLDEENNFGMLDGDKIAALVSSFIVDLVKNAGLDKQIEVGVVQTAYANGSSTRYLEKRVPVRCVPTGVKHLHHAAEHFSIGVYFEANGHGTVLFSPSTLDLLRTHEPSTPAQETAIKQLLALSELINQTVGDALSDMLLVEVVLAHRAFTAVEWDSLYTDLPNRLVKVVVPSRQKFITTDAERRLVEPKEVQARIDALVRKYDGGRAFVRPSGTEDVVRIYAEATLRPQVDELASRLSGVVYDFEGDQSKRPKEYL
ncbi:phosphoacetylglucosamine mutase [Sistotremastrum niveocremeum HHB9708]|uniref:Phosphoacetylglucosamine mutase n=1 Tax=Sistotremastrum niveocremeum HHB9708 TaxID=1314777 RepID=A0A164XHR9_9AGAM|nr:phosphoacetylglucosamine mutase [Sistotremastrum niveocremeum HHB9708]